MKKWILYLVLATSSGSVFGQTETINLFAGTPDIYGNGGDGGSATAATLGYPKDVAVDPAGNIYIADGEWQVIRKVSTSHIITRFAGNTSYDFTGDGGPATAASFNYVQGVGTDGLGNVYVVDGNNNRIRKIDLSGTITTVAGNGLYGSTGDGGPATAARLGYPNGVAGDALGNIYIADAGNYKIRKVDTGGIITTIAGTGSNGHSGDGGSATAAMINAPQKVAVDGTGNVYFSDAGNYIRKISTSGQITTIAGTGTAGHSGDGGPATTAQVVPSLGITVDPEGNLFFSDYLNTYIRKINASGIISTVSGNGFGGYEGDGGPASAAVLKTPMGVGHDAAGNIYFADGGNRVIRVIGAASTVVNSAPVFTGGAVHYFSVCSGSVFSIDTLLPISDADTGQTLTWTILSGPAHGAVSGLPYSATSTGGVVSPSGISYTSGPLYTGSDNIVVAVSDGTATTTTTLDITVAAAPSAGIISGTTSICAGTSSSLTSSVTGGTWSSSNPAVANMDSVTGNVTGVTGGTAIISYAVAGGCGLSYQYTTVTVNPLPVLSLLHGSAVSICPGDTMLLSADTFSAPPDTSFVGSTSFINSPAASGATTVCDCPSGYVVVGYSSQVYAWMDQFKLLCRHFSDGVLSGATVETSTNGTSTSALAGPYTFPGTGIMVGMHVNVANPYYSYPGAISGIIGYGQSAAYILAGSSNSASPTSLTAMQGFYDNHSAGDLYVPDGNVVTGMYTYDNLYSTGIAFRYRPISQFYSAGASWSSSNPSVVTVSTSGVITGISNGTAVITYSASNSCGSIDSLIYITVGGTPYAGTISGDTILYTGDSSLFSSTVTGGVWSVSNANATISSSGVLLGVSAGTVTVSYTVATPCAAGSSTFIVSILASTSPITGSTLLCEGSTTILADATAGGSWTSSNSSVATIGLTTGEVTAVGAGTATISYTTPIGVATTVVSVLALPGAISGPGTVCAGASISLSSSGVGYWFSGNPMIATVSGTGIVTGLTAGTANINYMSPEGCSVTRIVTVEPAPAAITGSTAICTGNTGTLTCSTGGGVSWISGDTTVATVGVSSGLVTGVSPGTTSVTYTVSTGCQVKVILTVNEQPSAISGDLYVCSGSTSVLSSTPSGGTWSVTNPAISAVDGAGAATGIAMGTTIITYSLSSGCMRSAVITVSPTPGPITGNTAICTGSSSTLASGTPGGSWVSSNTSIATVAGGIVTGVGTGTCDITYIAPGGCYRWVTVTVSTGPGANTGDPIVCAGQTTILSNATSGGTWASSNIAKATVVSSTGVVTGVTMGTANITYSTSAGCYTITQVTVNGALPAITGTTSMCIGGISTLANSVGGGSWSSGDETRVIVDGSGTVTGISAGTARITYALGTGCYKTIVVTVNATPSAITGTLSICIGATTALTNSTGGGLSWSSSSPAIATIAGSGIVTGLSAGTTSITYTVTSGCYTTAVVTVSAPPAGISGGGSICAGSTLALSSATTGGTWTSGNTTVATIGSDGTLTGLSAGTSRITYSGSSGCNTTTVITVTPAPSVSGAGGMCEGGSVTLAGSPTGGTWTSGSPAVASVSGSGVVSGLSSGTTVVTYSLGGGCVGSHTISVTAAPAANTGTSVVCVGQTTALANAVSGGTWSSASPSVASVNSITGLVAGVFAGSANITYATGAGCYAVTQVTVVSALTNITGASTICAGYTTTFTHPVPGGNWSSSNITKATVDASTGLVTGIAAGSANISYSIGGSCFKIKAITVTAPAAAISGVTTLCEGTTAVLSCSGGGLSWTSSDPSVATIGITSGLVTAISAGTTSITFNTTSGCQSVTVVTVNPLPAAVSGALEFCKGTTSTLSSPGSSGGSWTSSNTAKATVVSSTGVVTGVNAGTATIIYTWTNSCKSKAVVTIDPLPVAGAITGVGSLAVGASTLLTPSSPGGTWSSANTAIATVTPSTGSTATLTGVATGSVFITYTVTNGCGSAFVRRRFTVVAARMPADAEGVGPDVLQAFPNPTTGEFTIQSPVSGMLKIFALDGRAVLQYEMKPGDTSIYLPAELPNGTYVCFFWGTDGSEARVKLEYIR